MVNFPNFSHTKKFLSYSRNFFPILISFVMVAVSAGAYIYVWQNYRFQATEERLQQQIASLEIQLQQEQRNGVALREQLKDGAGMDYVQSFESKLPAATKEYLNREMGIDFSYLLDFGFENPVFLDDIEGKFGLCSSGNDFCVVGVDHKYYSSDLLPGADSFCAAKYKNMSQFCENGCEKTNENVAVDYRTSGYGDREFSVMAYSDLSAKYPSICFTLNLNDALDEASKKKGVGYYDISDSDVKSMIKNRELSDDVLQKVDAFVKMASTIKKIE